MDSIFLNALHRQKKDLELQLKEKFVSRTVAARLGEQLRSPLVKVILGPRRAGKSTLALQTLKAERFAYLSA